MKPAAFAMVIALCTILWTGSNSYSTASPARPLPAPASTTRKLLPDGTKLSQFNMADGTSCELMQNKDGSSEMIYKCAEGSSLVITKQSSGRSSAALLERNGHRRELTKQGCDARLQPGGLPKVTESLRQTSAPESHVPTPQTGVQQYR